VWNDRLVSVPASHDGKDGVVEARVSYWFNGDEPALVTYRSHGR
jgi:hypothetical protein